MTSLAQQSDADLGGPSSVLVRQKRDHEQLDRLLHELGNTVGDEQDEVLTKIGRLVFPHAYAEEVVLWPAIRASVPDGDALTLRLEQEHQEVNELFSALDRQPAAVERQRLLDRLVEVLREDVRDEEDELLPRLQAVKDPAALRRLGYAWELLRRTSPTRPHAVVSRRPPGNALSGLPFTVIDRSRDRLDRAARANAHVRPLAQRASRTLAGVAGRLEHLPAFTVGEKPSTDRTS